MIEGLAVKLAVVAALAGLIVLAVRRMNKQSQKIGGQNEHESAHKANDAARKRFDIATARALSSDAATLARRMAARAARALRLRRPPTD